MGKYQFNNLEHIHTLDGKPLCGTSMVCGIISKPLTWWASGLAVGTLGWVNINKSTKKEKLAKAKDALEMIKTLDAETYSDLLDKAYKAHAEKKDLAAEQGTDLHKEFEIYVKSCISSGGSPVSVHTKHKALQSFIYWACDNVKRFLASELYVYSREQWLGGICDVVYETTNGDIYIGDFKSSKEAYFSQFLQTALYHIQLTENNGGYDKDGNKILELESGIKGYAIFPFGSDFKAPTIRYASEDWTMAGVGAVKLYKLQNATN